MSESLNGIPREGWAKVTLGDIARNITENEYKPGEKGLDRCIGLEHLDPGALKICRWSPITPEMSFTRRFYKGQILFGKRRAYQKKVALADFDGICSSDILVIEPKKNKKFEPALLPFIMQDDRLFEYAVGTSSGSLSPRTKWKFLADYLIWLPSLEDQRRIATTLWAAEDCIVKGERFVAAAELAKQVLMRELFSKGIGHTEFTAIDGLEKFPKTWKSTKLGNVSQIDTGQSPDGATYNNSKIGVPLLNGPAEYGEVHPTPVQWTSSPTKICKKGDILICVRGSTTGRMNKADQEYCIGRGISAIRGINSISDTSFLGFLLELINENIVYIASGGGSTFPNITKNQLHEFEISCPPLPEQRQIAGILTHCDETIAAARANVAAAKALKMRLINEMLEPKKNNSNYYS